MTYFEGFIAPVPEANKDAYRKHARDFAPLIKEFGVGRYFEAWESDVPEGKVTDFRKAVDARPDEKIVFAFFEYPDKAARDAANDRFRSDPRSQEMGSNLPFDAQRLASQAFVGEVVMKEAMTPLLRAAAARGCRFQVGTDMLFEMIPAYLEFFGLGTATADELRAVARIV